MECLSPPVLPSPPILQKISNPSLSFLFLVGFIIIEKASGWVGRLLLRNWFLYDKNIDIELVKYGAALLTGTLLLKK